jgi:hypothetical protein
MVLLAEELVARGFSQIVAQTVSKDRVLGRQAQLASVWTAAAQWGSMIEGQQGQVALGVHGEPQRAHVWMVLGEKSSQDSHVGREFARTI